jgi:hypothetical protein
MIERTAEAVLPWCCPVKIRNCTSTNESQSGKKLRRSVDYRERVGVSASSAYRELDALETLQLMGTRGLGKRTFTEHGIAYLDNVFRP